MVKTDPFQDLPRARPVTERQGTSALDIWTSMHSVPYEHGLAMSLNYSLM